MNWKEGGRKDREAERKNARREGKGLAKTETSRVDSLVVLLLFSLFPSFGLRLRLCFFVSKLSLRTEHTHTCRG